MRFAVRFSDGLPARSAWGKARMTLRAAAVPRAAAPAGGADPPSSRGSSWPAGYAVLGANTVTCGIPVTVLLVAGVCRKRGLLFCSYSECRCRPECSACAGCGVGCGGQRRHIGTGGHPGPGSATGWRGGGPRRRRSHRRWPARCRSGARRRARLRPGCPGPPLRWRAPVERRSSRPRTAR